MSADFQSAFKTRKLTCDDGLAVDLQVAAAALSMSAAAMAQAYFIYVLNRKGSSNHITKDSLQAFVDHQQQHQKKVAAKPVTETLTFTNHSWDALSDVLGDNTNLQHATPTRPVVKTAGRQPDSVPSTASTPFSNRKQRGQVQAFLNQHLSLPASDEAMQVDGQQRCVVHVLEAAEPISSTYMIDRLQNKVEYLENRISSVAKAMGAGGAASDQHADAATPADDLVTGRICCDSEGRLNERSVLLEGSQAASGGARLRLDLSKLESFRLFPGQVVGVRGANPTGDCLIVSELISAAPPPMACSTAEDLARYASATGPSGLSMIVAAGPFSSNEDTAYEPLQALLDHCQQNPVDVILLLGPFVDSEHTQVAGGKLDTTFTEVFETQVLMRLQEWVHSTNSTARILLIPSTRDVHHTPVFPQPPFVAAEAGQVTMLPNPATFSCNEVTVACSTHDILKHLAGQEVQRTSPGADRMASLAQHLVGQRSVYPLYPPAPGAMLDSSRGAALEMATCPDILLLPSDLAPFAKLVPTQPGITAPADSTGNNAVVAVNPGRLIRSTVGGQFARLQIGASAEGLAVASGQPAATNGKLRHAVAGRCTVEIRRI